MTIPEQSVQAVYDHLCRVNGEWQPIGPNDIKDVLTAALPHLPGVGVKGDARQALDRFSFAAQQWGWQADQGSNDAIINDTKAEFDASYAALERILSALVPSNKPGTFDLDQISPDQRVNISRPESQRTLEPSAARELALEEAAAMLEAKAEAANNRAVAFTEKLSGPLKGRKKSEQWRSEKTHNERIKFYYQKAAAAIRALSSPDHADAGKVEGDGGAAARDVLAERRRQIEAEGWDHYHDDANERAELAQAAACYALSGTPADEAVFIHGRWEDPRDLFWPHGWSREWWKPTNRRRDLVKAGALILAEIERIDRLPSAPSQEVAG